MAKVGTAVGGSTAQGDIASPAAAATVSVARVIERSPFAMAAIDARTHAVRFANSGFYRLAGPAGELIVVPRTVDTPATASAARIAPLLRRVADTGSPISEVEVEAAGIAGRAMLLSVSVWPVAIESGDAGILILLATNGTALAHERRRRAETSNQLREINERLVMATLREAELKDKAEAASEAKSIFLATMSHELRTPLAAIMGYQELLANSITGPVTEAQRVQLGRIKQSAAHLLALIDQVLTLARVDAGPEIVGSDPVDVAELVETVSTLITPLAAAKGLAYAVEVPATPVTLASDPLRVRQILVNLLGNAVKFCERGEVMLRVRETDGDVVFQVIDSGIGIAPEHIPHVFDAFWQVQQTPTRRFGGSGLGLSVARRLARALGGDVTVDSVPNAGSTFALRLPALPPTP